MRKLVIIITFILLILGVGITYSMFFSKANLLSNDQAIAKFIFDAEETNNIHLPLININPGDIKEYLFSVSNNENGFTSEVTISYQISIKTYHFIPLDIKLYKIDEQESEHLIMKCDESYSRVQNQLICNSDIQDMLYSLEIMANYRLVIEFPSEYHNETYSGLVDFIDLEIKSWQKLED